MRTDKKKFLIYKEIQNGAVAKSYIEEGLPNTFLYVKKLPNTVYEEMRKYFTIYKEAVSHMLYV
jgi:hypothetical protein